jgi:hypothetical protein
MIFIHVTLLNRTQPTNQPKSKLGLSSAQVQDVVFCYLLTNQPAKKQTNCGVLRKRKTSSLDRLRFLRTKRIAGIGKESLISSWGYAYANEFVILTEDLA